MDNVNVKDLLLGFAQVINEQSQGLPAGCISKNANGVFNAKSVSDLTNMSNDVDAADGFIRNGLMVRFVGQRKANKDEKFRGYRVVFELNGLYNGPYIIFTRTEFEYKIYMAYDMWKISTCEILYKGKDEDTPDIKRVYKIPMVHDKLTDEYTTLDRNNTIENKVKLAMSSKLGRDYDAYLGDLKFNEVTSKFEIDETNEEDHE